MISSVAAFGLDLIILDWTGLALVESGCMIYVYVYFDLLVGTGRYTNTATAIKQCFVQVDVQAL